MIFWIRHIFDSLLYILLPKICISCNNNILNGEICHECWGSLFFITGNMCQKCGVPFEFQIENEIQCLHCQESLRYFDSVRSPLTYNDISAKIVKQLKYTKRYNHAIFMAREIFKHTRDVLDLNKKVMITGIPMLKDEFFSKSFNHSFMIASELAKLHKNFKFSDKVLRKVKKTKKQSSLNKQGRMKNLHGAFEAGAVKYGTVLIVDDVITTGSTINECAKVIKKRYPDVEVIGVSFARTCL